MVMPTGAGKTVTFGLYIGESRAQKVLLIAHRKEIVEQAVRTLQTMYPDRSVGVMMAGQKDYDADIVCAMIQTVSRRKTLELMRKDFDLIIVDETHHAPANTYKRVLYAYGLLPLADAGAKNVEAVSPHYQANRRLLGVTATPRRTDKQTMDAMFDELTVSVSIVDLIPKYLSDFRVVSVKSGVDLSHVRSKFGKGDLREEEVAEAMLDSEFIQSLPDILAQHAVGRKHVLVFLPNRETTYTACATLNAAGIPARAVLGETPRAEREASLAAFRMGDVRVLCNCMVLTEGVDIPQIDCILVGRPTKSAPLLVQMIGRGLRAQESKSDCLIIDIAHERRQSDLISVAGSGIFGSTADLHFAHPDESYLQLAARHRERLPVLMRLLGVLEQRIAQLTEEEEAKPRRTDTLDTMEIADKAGMPPPAMQHQLPEGLLLVLDTAFLRSIVADIDMEISDMWFEFIDALRTQWGGWRLEDSTDKQRDVLVRYGLDADNVSILKKGEASAIISVLKRHEPITTKQRKMLSVLGVNAEGMPTRKAEASRMIQSLMDNDTDDSTESRHAADPMVQVKWMRVSQFYKPGYTASAAVQARAAIMKVHGIDKSFPFHASGPIKGKYHVAPSERERFAAVVSAGIESIPVVVSRMTAGGEF